MMAVVMVRPGQLHTRSGTVLCAERASLGRRERHSATILVLYVLLGGLFLGCGKKEAIPECLAPANAGGGWDLTCRAFARALSRALEGAPPLRVRNLPGAGGGIAFANVVSQRDSDPGVIVAASPATTLRLAQGQFGDFTEEDVRWLGAIGADYGVVAVRADAPWPNLPSLMAQWKREPDTIVVSGGSAVGGQDHLKALLLARAVGIELRRVRYVPYDGGGEAMTALLGGFVQVASMDASESRGQWEAGAIRLLAVIAEHRLLEPFDDVPTTVELGYPVDWPIWRGFYAPPGISEAVRREWLRRIDAVVGSTAWTDQRRRLGLSPLHLSGDPFEAFVRDQVRTFRGLTEELGLAR